LRHLHPFQPVQDDLRVEKHLPSRGGKKVWIPEID
jgi:hypothetical protein